MLATIADGDLRVDVIQTVFTLQFSADRGFKLRPAVGCCVFGVAFADRVDACLFHIVRGIEIRLADGETNDILACSRHLHRFGVHGNRR